MTETFELKKGGFNRIFKSDTWLIASIGHSEMYSEENFDHMKRHLTTDEVFVLIEGSATLYTFEDEKMVETPLEKGKMCVVGKGTWHYLCASEDALITVVENKDLLPQDTERIELECLVRK